MSSESYDIALATLPLPGNPTQSQGDEITVMPAPQDEQVASLANSQGESSSAILVRSKFQLWATLLALFLSLFLAALDFTIATTAIPTITASFHSASGYSWIGSTYLLASAASTPICGKFSDIWGRKIVLLAAVATFFVGSAVCAGAHSMAVLLVGRSIQGAAAGGVVILVNICISDLFSMRDRGLYLGLTGVVWGLASGIGPLLGGALTEYVSWRWNWWINLPFSALSFVVLCFCLRVHNPRTNLWKGMQAIDWLGTAAVLGLSLMTLLGLNFGGVVSSWDSAKVICLIVIGFLMAIMFVLYEAKVAKNPLMPVRILYGLSNKASLLVCFAHGFVNVSSWYFLPLYFQSSRSLTPLRSGVLLIPVTLVQALTGILAGYLIHRTGCYLPLIYLGMFLTTIGFSLFIILSASSPLFLIIIFEVIAGLGVGLVFQPPLIALQSAVSNDDVAVATALFGFVRSLSTSVSIVIGDVVFQNQMQSHQEALRVTLPDSIAELFSGDAAAANVNVIKTLSSVQKSVVRNAFAQSLSTMWIMYACIAGIGLLLSFGIQKQALSQEHVETKTGIEKSEPRVGNGGVRES